MTTEAHAVTCANCGEDAPKDTPEPIAKFVWLCDRCEREVDSALSDDSDTDDEVTVQLADGWSLQSGSSTDAFTCGEYVRLCRPDGSEYLYWDQEEWATEPVLVMGAIINAASGYRPADLAADPSA